MGMYDAENEGLVFHGATARYWRDEEVAKLKDKAKEIRKLGFKAKTVKSLKSEWGCGDYVLMVEPKYQEYRSAAEHVFLIQNAEERITKVQVEADKKIAQIKDEVTYWKDVCDKFGIKY